MKKLPQRGKQLVQGHLEMTELEFEPMLTGLVGQEGSYPLLPLMLSLKKNGVCGMR